MPFAKHWKWNSQLVRHLVDELLSTTRRLVVVQPAFTCQVEAGIMSGTKTHALTELPHSQDESKD